MEVRGPYFIGGWLDLRAGMEEVAKGENPAPAGNRTPVVQPVAAICIECTCRASYRTDARGARHSSVLHQVKNVVLLPTSAVSTGWAAGVRFPEGPMMGFFSSAPLRPDRLCGPTQPPIQWVPGIKRPGREANHSSTCVIPSNI